MIVFPVSVVAVNRIILEGLMDKRTGIKQLVMAVMSVQASDLTT
jgi:hypothetical protein